ncbi:MAG: phosphotransferase [Terracidiphilus sp.]|jgi:aminoglycoside phosphotransferase (APT) family kinase protein
MREASDFRRYALTMGRILKAKYEKHFHSPQAVIDAVVQRATGSSVARRVQITKGETNEVYAVDLANGQKVIVRTSRSERSRFRAERWAIEQCARAGVPVPCVIAVETIEHAGRPLNLSIETLLQGTPLDELAKDNLSPETVAALLHRTGAVLARIHSIRTNGFGELDENGSGNYNSIGDMLSQEELSKEHFLNVARAVHIDSGIIERALNALYEYSVRYPAISPRLIHNDFAPCHVLICDGQVSGIVDFEIAQGGDPAREFARWQFFFGDRFALRHLIEGYGNSAGDSKEFQDKLHIWTLYIGLINMDWYSNKRNKQKVDLCRVRLTEEVSYFS